MAYVYIYLDPRLNPPQPIYIGKGSGNRLDFHKTRAKNQILKRKISKIRDLGLEPIVEVFKDNITDTEALILEMELISKYGRIDNGTGILCNLTEGGEGSSGWIPSEETKNLWSEQRKGKKQTPAQYAANCNRNISEESRRKQSEASKGHSRHTSYQLNILKEFNTGKKHSDETKELMSKQRKGKKQTPAQYAANCNRIPKSKKIFCLTNNKIYESAKDAAEKLGLNYTAIQAVANGSRTHHKNFKFQYID
jgi:hypothetical protein